MWVLGHVRSLLSIVACSTKRQGLSLAIRTRFLIFILIYFMLFFERNVVKDADFRLWLCEVDVPTHMPVVTLQAP
jgi:hypothetical protein